MLTYAQIAPIAAAASKAAQETLQELASEECTQEPAVTDRLLARIKDRINDRVNDNLGTGIVWKAKTMSDRAPRSQEYRTGADFLGVLHISLHEFRVTKGFLAQAKLVEPAGRIRDPNKLRSQCEQMLDISPHSFLFLYAKTHITIVPAISVLAAPSLDPHKLRQRSVFRFFLDHLSCFIGDRRISGVSNLELEGLLERTAARNVLFIQASRAFS